MEKRKLEEDVILQENQKYFKRYLVFPKIVTVILAIVLVVVGIVLGNIFYSTNRDSRIALLVIICVLGAGVCALAYYLMRVLVSYKILHIYYLKKFAEKDEIKQENDKAL